MLLAASLGLTGWLATIAWFALDDGRPSTCYGTVTGGRLNNGKRLAFAGENYQAFSIVLFALGRTFTHSAVRDAMRDAYLALANSDPGLRFIYAETGWPWGGRFAPHKTHRNGTAVDFHVPVRDSAGQVALLPTTLANHFGYEIEFDSRGRYAGLQIDFEAMAKHLIALDSAAREHGIAIQRVIFDKMLQPLLFAAPSGRVVQERIAFNERQVRVRHDEHYHVDFSLPCKLLSGEGR